MSRRLAHALVWLAFTVTFQAPLAAGEEALGVEPAMLDLPHGASRSGPRLDRLTEEVAGLIRCPVCRGVSVAESPSTTAVDMKREIRALLAEGYSAQQVSSTFEQAYGEVVRLEPKAEGLGWLVWLAPFAGLVAGLALTAGRLRAAAAHRRVVAPEETACSIQPRQASQEEPS